MLTFLLSINNCLTKSLAKDSQWFSKRICILTFKVFCTKTGVWGKKQKVVWMPYKEDELWILMVSVRDHSFKCLGHPALGWWCPVVERVKLGVCLVLSSSSALGQMTFPVSTLASFTYKSDIMIPTTCDVDSLLNNSKCNHMSTNCFPYIPTM